MSTFSRRRFLEDSLWSAAAAAVVGASRSAWSKEKESTSSANERLSCAVLGVGKRGIDHATAFASRGDTEVAVLCDADSEIGQKRCDEVASVSRYRPRYEQDLRKVLDDKSIDIVSIALPNHWHALAAIWAMQAGKDVYLEKPVSYNVAEGRAIVETARKYGRICQTGTQHRSLSGLREAIAYLHSGQLGEVKLARGLCYKSRRSIGPAGNYRTPSTVNYDLWCGPAPIRPVTRKQFHYDWHWFWDYGNGEIGNQGVHQMDMARWGLGADSHCSNVISYGGRFGFNDVGETANTHVLTYNFGSKSLVFEVRALKTNDFRGARIGVIFEATEGWLVWNSGLAGGTAFDPEGRQLKTFVGGTGDHFDNFISAVRSRKIEQLHADILEGHLSSALCHLGNISYRLGEEVPLDAVCERLQSVQATDDIAATLDRTISHLNENNLAINDRNPLRIGQLLDFDPRKEKFTASREADELLSRTYRSGFAVPSLE